ncbi:MAG: AAA family ATPase [Methanobacteriaceae archaeon]
MKTENGDYKNQYNNSKNSKKINMGMFGTGFMTFKNKLDRVDAQKFLKLCVDIQNMVDNNTPENEIFEQVSNVINNGIKGLGTASISQILHCLNPFVFPILNGAMGHGTKIYDILGITLKTLYDVNYVHNSKLIKNLRDEKFSFVKNYRAFDLLNFRLFNSAKNVWLLAPGSNAKYWDEFRDKNVIAIGWGDLGDLSKYKDNKEHLFSEIERIYPKHSETFNAPNSNKTSKQTNNVRGLYDFYNVMEIGDIVFIKSGTSTLLGIGVITSDYKFSNESIIEKSNYNHIRNVKWIILKEVNLPKSINLTIKTLTNISYINYRSNPYFYQDLAKAMDFDIDSYMGNDEKAHINNFIKNLNQKFNDYKNLVLISEKNYSESTINTITHIYNQFTDFIKENEITHFSDLYSLLELFIKTKDIKSKKDYKTYLLDFIDYNGKILPNYTKESFLQEVIFLEENYDELVNILKRKKNIILQGSPGVGKTFIAKRLAYSIMGCKDESRVEFVQFHQSYSYEDFIQGYRPTEEGFELNNGIFYNFCRKAAKDIDNDYYFIIDEINRGNISKIFGELMMLIEEDKRGEDFAINLTYYNAESKFETSENESKFHVPENVHIIGMMNTADRSLAIIDYALRRRFVFYTIPPLFDEYSENGNIFKNHLIEIGTNEGLANDIINKFGALNDLILKDEDLGTGFRIGHSYFCGKCTKDNQWYNSIINYEIAPLLREYWFDDLDKADDEIEKLLNIPLYYTKINYSGNNIKNDFIKWYKSQEDKPSTYNYFVNNMDNFERLEQIYEESFGSKLFNIDVNNLESEINIIEKNLKSCNDINNNEFIVYNKNNGNGIPHAIIKTWFIKFLKQL